MKRNVNDTLTVMSLLLTLTGITFGQNLPQPLMSSSEKANDERYAGHFAWSQLIPRLHGSSVDNLRLNDAGESQIMDGVMAKNSFPATVKGNAAQLPRGRNVGQPTVYPAEGSEFEVGSYRTQRMAKRYKLSFYDCIALYCQEAQGDSRNSCILNSCNRSRSWPRN